MESSDEQKNSRVILVTGPSGAGRSTAINVLEDLGFETIDNLPLSLLPRLLDGPMDRALAIGLDVRNRDFAVNSVLNTFRHLSSDPDFTVDLLYVDCRPDVLLQRFSETRRRHPLAPNGAPDTGIAMEIDLLEPIRHQATVLFDTTQFSPHELRSALTEWYDPTSSTRMAISVQSFSYKRGVPPGADMVFDCRFLRNPHWDASLRAKDGRDDDVKKFIEEDPRYPDFLNTLSQLMELLLPAFKEEGKAHLIIGFGCTGGQHRSVAMAEQLGNQLANQGWRASIRHRELERRARSAPAPSGESA